MGDKVIGTFCTLTLTGDAPPLSAECPPDDAGDLHMDGVAELLCVLCDAKVGYHRVRSVAAGGAPEVFCTDCIRDARHMEHEIGDGCLVIAEGGTYLEGAMVNYVIEPPLTYQLRIRLDGEGGPYIAAEEVLLPDVAPLALDDIYGSSRAAIYEKVADQLAWEWRYRRDDASEADEDPLAIWNDDPVKEAQKRDQVRAGWAALQRRVTLHPFPSAADMAGYAP